MRLLPMLCLASLVAGVSPALAQQSEQERSALARSLFEEGVSLGEAGQWPDAADRYRRVLALRPTPQVKYNLALALSHTGAVVEPVELCRQILRDSASPAAARADAQALVARLEPQIARLTVRVSGDPDGAQVRLDGAPLEQVSLGVAMPVDPGPHEITASRGREVVATAATEVAAGASGEVSLEIPPRPAPDVPTAAETAGAAATTSTAPVIVHEDDGGGGAGWLPWALLGAAVVAGGVVAIVLLTGASDDELGGNLMPGRIVFE